MNSTVFSTVPITKMDDLFTIYRQKKTKLNNERIACRCNERSKKRKRKRERKMHL